MLAERILALGVTEGEETAMIRTALSEQLAHADSRIAQLQQTVPGAASASFEQSAVLATRQLRLVREVSIDGNTHNLVAVSWILVGSRGRLAVAQQQDRAVVLFDSTGRPDGRVGRMGDGPGEFRSVTSAGFVGDSLWVHDLLGRRTTLFSPDLRVIRTVESDGTLAMFPNGTWLARARRTQSASAPQVDTGGLVINHISTSGAVVRVVARITPFPERSLSATGEGMTMMLTVPHLAPSLFKTSSRGSRMAALTTVYSGADANTIRLVVLSINGDTVFARNYPFQAERIPAAAADEAAARAISNMTKALGGRSSAMPASFRDELRRRVPPVYPPYSDMLVGDDGVVWIALHRTASDAPRPQMLIDARGNDIGRITLPANTTPLVVSATHMWGVERDSLDVPSVVRFRVVR
jgi:hypothetical protein